MKRDDSSPQRLLEQMGHQVVPMLSPEREAALQARSARAVDRLLERVTERRHLLRGRISGAVAAVAAVAAVVALAFAGSWLSASRRLVADQGSQLVGASGAVALSKGSGLPPSAVKPGVALASGDLLTTAAGAHATLSLADHALVELAADTRLRVVQTPGSAGEATDERLELTLGELSFQVPKLKSGQTLSVRTPDSLVTVRGTRFTVTVERRGGQGVVTRVSVSDGRVEVESRGQTLFLTRGERWSSVREPEPSNASAVAAEEPVKVLPEVERSPSPSDRDRVVGDERARSPTRPAERARSLSAEVQTPREVGRASTLAEENKLYEGALAFAQAGAAARALTELETLMREHPRSPLIQSARVEHFRVLLKMGNAAAAAREARRYLSEYPAGFARDEARQIVLRGLGDAE